MSIPDSWGADKDGHVQFLFSIPSLIYLNVFLIHEFFLKPTTDPEAVMHGGGLLPLGGVEETSENRAH